MIKLVHKKHMHHSENKRGIVIYYDLSEIILGFLLVSLVAFFVYNYLQNNLTYKQPQVYPLMQNSGPSAVKPAPATIKK